MVLLEFVMAGWQGRNRGAISVCRITDTEGNKTIGNWYTTLLNSHGNPIKHYGDLDLEMSRKKLDRVGAIKKLMR